MFDVSREREEIETPFVASRQSDNSFPLHGRKELPKVEGALIPNQEKDYEMDMSRSIDSTISTRRTPCVQQTEMLFRRPPFSTIDHDCYLPTNSSSSSTSFARPNQFERLHPSPNRWLAPHTSLVHGESAPCPIFTPPLVSSPYLYDSSDDEPSADPKTPKQGPQLYRTANASKRTNCPQTSDHIWRPSLPVQKPTDYDTLNNVLCCYNDYINSEISFPNSGPHIETTHLQSTDASLSLDRAVLIHRVGAPRPRLDSALARLDAALNRERRQRTRDGLPAEGAKVPSNINFTIRLIPRGLLNLESGKSSWISNVYRQATEWILDVRIVTATRDGV